MSPSEDFNKGQYQTNFQQYLDSNQNGEIGGGLPSQRVSLLQEYLPSGRTVLEIGSGDGKDAQTLKDRGYKVIASDFVDSFIAVLKKKDLETLNLDAKKDPLPNVDAIYANAVFVHFSPEEITDFLQRAKGMLLNEKLIFLSVIKGEGHERSARSRGFERDFYYYTLGSLTSLLKQSDFKIIYSNDINTKWIQVIAKSE